MYYGFILSSGWPKAFKTRRAGVALNKFNLKRFHHGLYGYTMFDPIWNEGILILNHICVLLRFESFLLLLILTISVSWCPYLSQYVSVIQRSVICKHAQIAYCRFLEGPGQSRRHFTVLPCGPYLQLLIRPAQPSGERLLYHFCLHYRSHDCLLVGHRIICLRT